MPSHTTVSISKNLHGAIKEFIKKHPELGYTSVAEFCKEAIRDKLSELKVNMEKSPSIDYLSSAIEEIRSAMNIAPESTASLFNAIKEPFAIFSAPHGSLIMYNEAFQKLSGYENEELLGMHFRDFIVPEYLPKVEKNFWNRINGGKAEDRYVVKARNKKGEVISIEITSNQYIKNGRIAGVGVLIREVKKE